MKATMEKTIKYRNIGIFYISFPYHTYIAIRIYTYVNCFVCFSYCILWSDGKAICGVLCYDGLSDTDRKEKPVCQEKDSINPAGFKLTGYFFVHFQNKNLEKE